MTVSHSFVVIGQTNHVLSVFCTTTKNLLSHEQYSRMLTEAPVARRKWDMKVQKSTQRGHLYMITWLSNELTNWNKKLLFLACSSFSHKQSYK